MPTTRTSSLPPSFVLASGVLLFASAVSAQSSRRVLLLREGPPDAAADARVQARLAGQPGVESVAVASASLSDILLAAGCDELSACATQIARAARADLLVVRSRGADASLRVVDPDAPQRARTVADARDAIVARPVRASPRPLTWALGAASLALFAGAGIAGGLSIATGDAYAAQRMADADALETYALIVRGQTEATIAGVLTALGAATAVMTTVMLAFDLGDAPGGASLALSPAVGGVRADVRWWF